MPRGRKLLDVEQCNGYAIDSRRRFEGGPEFTLGQGQSDVSPTLKGTILGIYMRSRLEHQLHVS